MSIMKDLEDESKYGTMRYYASKVHTVISCPTCAGTGYRSHEEISDYHRRDYETVYTTCQWCNGEGRMVETKTTITFNVLDFPSVSTEKKTKCPYSEFPLDKLQVVEDREQGNLEFEGKKC